MPGIRKRLPPDVAFAYGIYRQLSARAHASMISSVFRFAMGGEGLLELSPHYVEEDPDNLGFAAAMVSQLAGRALGTLDASLVVAFLDLNLEFLEAVGYDLEPLRNSIEEGRPPPGGRE